MKRREPEFTDMSWQVDGVCREIDPELFFADSKEVHAQRDAIRACGLCRVDVRAKCLQWAIDNDEEWGIWGGATPPQRVDIARLMAQQPELDVLEAAELVAEEPALRLARRWQRTSVLDVATDDGEDAAAAA